ncbi:protein adenylyltransferase SelO, mitochondrial isoform X2 [Trichosurus vulpecula]|uniref:protein adenylyltransferase SelO, mitochondrial isoform X2 n=1 Tax=Trichosurus vulpecula TaxID=9337 RepID=UPI00186ACF3C|nr:protein adenylyltransferase SelO, mitochondrial isoform X2 [Trichosurus vulpecula]
MEPQPAARGWLTGLRFDNRALRALPVEEPPPGGDPAPRPVPGACFSRVRPSPLREPRLVALSAPALALLGLGPPPPPGAGPESEEEARKEEEAGAGAGAPGSGAEAELELYFSGNALLPGSEPAAHCYCGHQFGSFAGQLGDGAAMYLGEVLGPGGQRWELQLKGAGLTPFSRQADGRKVLRSSIREFLCSEAMFHLGIPTTRAGSCVTSESKVIRDIYYDGNPKYENCAVVLRIASTFLRFGSFEIFKPPDEHTGRKGPSVGRNDIRIQMLDYVISSFYPEIQAAFAENSVQRNAAFFREVTRRTARLVADWQCVGFCHGVLNTDNMSIVGLTIDYGPFGFMDRYDPDHICNSSDTSGRYAYNKQPEVCKWNLQKLAEALVPELPLEVSERILEEEYDTEFEKHYLHKMRRKLGLIQLELEEDRELVSALLETMHLTGADFTNTFYLLSSFSVAPEPTQGAYFLDQLAQQCASLEELKLAFRPQMDPRQLSMMLMLAQSNPQLFALIGTKASINKELERIEQSSKLQHLSAAELISRNRERWEAWLQRYRARLERDMPHASSMNTWNTERIRVMRSNNPKYILRNYIAQNAIEAAEQGDFSEEGAEAAGETVL